MYLESTTWKSKTKWEESFLRLCVSFFSKEATTGKFNVRTSLVDKSLPAQKAPCDGVGGRSWGSSFSLPPPFTRTHAHTLLLAQYLNVAQENWAAQTGKSRLSSQAKGWNLQAGAGLPASQITRPTAANLGAGHPAPGHPAGDRDPPEHLACGPRALSRFSNAVLINQTANRFWNTPSPAQHVVTLKPFAGTK